MRRFVDFIFFITVNGQTVRTEPRFGGVLCYSDSMKYKVKKKKVSKGKKKKKGY